MFDVLNTATMPQKFSQCRLAPSGAAVECATAMEGDRLAHCYGTSLLSAALVCTRAHVVPIMLRHRQERSAGSHEGPKVPSGIPAPRILVVEDELLIALMIEEMLRESGYRVSGTAHTIILARQELARRNFDAVLLDVNFDGRPRPELADLLVERAVPFAFVTGYDYVLEPRHENVPVLQKPFTFAQFRVLLTDLVGPGSSRGKTALSA
jgi:CheY-like chemotaxis protein